MRRLRAYRLQTFGKDDAVLLEDRLHNYVHSENILEGDANGGIRKLPENSVPLSDVLVSQSQNGLYGILRLNEFDVEVKTIKRLRLFRRMFPWFIGEPKNLPTHEIGLLLSGEEVPLIAIHDFLVQDPRYCVSSAQDVERANWFAQTESQRNGKDFIDVYLNALTEHISTDFQNLQYQFNISHDLDSYRGVMSVTGPIDPLLKLRKELKTGFHGLKVGSEAISYS